jgi:hypothetical protein
VRIQLYKMGRGFVPVGDDAEKVHDKMSPGEIAWFKPLRVRDPIKHGRYWGLMTLCADNCERIELPYSSVMIVNSKEDVHTAVKLCTGLCDTIFDAFGKPAFQIPKSTNFESMDADEWDLYWPKVTDVVQERILPGVEIPEVEMEIQKCMGWAR